MKINNLLDKYTFHDSTIEGILYNKEDNELIINIDFCLWAQDDYINGNKENSMMSLVFHNVNEYDGLIGEIDSFEILDILETKKGIKLNIEDAFNNKFYVIEIESNDVDFIPLKNKVLI